LLSSLRLGWGPWPHFFFPPQKWPECEIRVEGSVAFARNGGGFVGRFIGPMGQLGGRRTDCAEFLLKMAFLRTRAALEVSRPKEKMDSTRRARAHENVPRAPPRRTISSLSNYFGHRDQLRAKRELPARTVNFPPCDGQLVSLPRPLSFPSSKLGRPAAPFACGNLASLPWDVKGPSSSTWRRSRLGRASENPSCLLKVDF